MKRERSPWFNFNSGNLRLCQRFNLLTRMFLLEDFIFFIPRPGLFKPFSLGTIARAVFSHNYLKQQNVRFSERRLEWAGIEPTTSWSQSKPCLPQQWPGLELATICFGVGHDNRETEMPARINFTLNPGDHFSVLNIWQLVVIPEFESWGQRLLSKFQCTKLLSSDEPIGAIHQILVTL